MVMKEKVMKSALLARNDTGFNLTVYLNKEVDENGQRRAKGWLYLDDGESYNYQRLNQYQMIAFEFSDETLSSHHLNLKKKPEDK